MQTCNDQCRHYKAEVSPGLRSYRFGVFHCTTCDQYVTVNGIEYSGKAYLCRCCHQKIRMRPRYKEKVYIE
jgi:hypothetical protein